MYWEGFLRSILSDLWIGVGVIFISMIFYGVVYIVVRGKAFSSEDAKEDAKSVMRVVRTVVVVLVLVVVVTLFGRAASVAFANRTPRQDIDKNPVYEQMDSHGQKGRR